MIIIMMMVKIKIMMIMMKTMNLTCTNKQINYKPHLYSYIIINDSIGSNLGPEDQLVLSPSTIEIG